MMDSMISLFIDNELSLDEKTKFVKRVHEDRAFKDDSIELLEQEKLIRSRVVDRVPALKFKTRRAVVRPILRPVGLFASGLTLGLLVFFLYWPFHVSTSVHHRFVIHRPDVSQAEIAGTFTEWKRIRMNRVGSSGYWEITLDLPEGEHRFTYILDSHNQIADPTIPTREQDDFGGENSILLVESQA